MNHATHDSACVGRTAAWRKPRDSAAIRWRVPLLLPAGSRGRARDPRHQRRPCPGSIPQAVAPQARACRCRGFRRPRPLIEVMVPSRVVVTNPADSSELCSGERSQIAGDALVLGQALARFAGLGVQGSCPARPPKPRPPDRRPSGIPVLPGLIPGKKTVCPVMGGQNAQVAEQRDAMKSRALAAATFPGEKRLGRRLTATHVDEVEKSVSALSASRGVDEAG